MSDTFDELPAGPPIEPASASESSDSPGGEFSAAGRQAHEAAHAAQDGSGRENGDALDAEPGLDVAAVLAALQRDDRDPASGRFKAGHVRNLRHGRYARHLWDATPLAEFLAEHTDALVSHYGGRDNLGPPEHALVVELARIELLTAAAGDNLVRDGLTTTKGRVRAACSLWLSLLDRQSRLAAQLGLQRRARPAESITEWAARATNEPKA